MRHDGGTAALVIKLTENKRPDRDRDVKTATDKEKTLLTTAVLKAAAAFSFFFLCWRKVHEY